ncbi:MAG TPA: hypothetical protein VK327_05195 [Candidatus Paceibacterota bacterium]|nr:hypothetical protein [Candidatus Paceibacterota bacterium]
MKFNAWFVAVASTVVLAANAQPEMIIKQRARGAANGNAAQPVTPAPAAVAPRPTPVATPPNAQQQRVARLKADLAEVRSAGNVTDQVKRNFELDLVAIAQGSHKPSTNSVAALANSLLPALSDRKISAGLNERLMQKLVVLMNCHGLSASRAQEIIEEAKTAMTSCGISTDVAAKIATDLQAIVTEIQTPASQ